MLVISFHDAVLRKAQKMIDIMMRRGAGQTEGRVPCKRRKQRKVALEKEESWGKSGVRGVWLGGLTMVLKALMMILNV